MTDPRAFVAERHAGQTYGDDLQPYTVHLQAVEQVLADFGYVAPIWVAGAWLHDVLEDTPITRAELAELFGENVASLVYAVTGYGPNRRTSNASIYAKVRISRRAAILKTADRIANVEASAPGSSHARMYYAERDAFVEAVAFHVPLTMLSRLLAAHKRLAP